MKKIYIEMSCDVCGAVDYLPHGTGDVDKHARRNGWIITSKGKHLCSKECHSKLTEHTTLKCKRIFNKREY